MMRLTRASTAELESLGHEQRMRDLDRMGFNLILERDAKKWIPAFSHKSRSKSLESITFHGFGSTRSKTIVI